MKQGPKTLVQVFRSAEPDYQPSAREDFDEEADGRAGLLKEILAELPDEDRALFIAYAEVGSAKKLGDLAGLTKQTAWRAVTEIRKKILNEYERRKHSL